ncbi:MAG: PAS domain-containing protein [Dechloromonas sp.]|uniref:PAS domain-containing protein n=1 Tax=Candidatus Dechloromonas phosphorivorans TaxID=2899244 RepID=A0A935K1Y0_9RHOO|nr:PAS domain-containing protein [Candidatus Dechloromonas phosphorivorans]
MARQIRKIRAGELAETAYLEEKKRADDPSTSSLLDAMKSLYRLIAIRNDSLQKLNESLESQVADRTQELSKTNSVLLQEQEHLKAAMAQVEITQKKLFESEHKRNEAAKRHMELFLAQIIDGDPVPTFVIDANHRVTHWNRACAAISGEASSDVIGTDFHWRPFYTSQRPTLADLIVNGSLDDQLETYYHGLFRRSKPSPALLRLKDFSRPGTVRSLAIFYSSTTA